MTPVLPGSCRGESLAWFAPSDADHRARLDAWCAGVGGPVIALPTHDDERAHAALTDFTFVSWNVHVGNGDLRAFVRDLRAGMFTDGRPVRDFVLMLQEVVRSEGVPVYRREARGAARIAAPTSTGPDIVTISRDLELSLLYVPSMRNGNSALDEASDRGSAILATRPLRDPVAIELPGERQRRVAVIATVELGSGANTPLTVGTIHLDALGTARRLWVFGTPWMRSVQVKSMASLLPDGALVLGADLNTWHGRHEPAAEHLQEIFEDVQVSSRRGATLLALDYLFFRGSGTHQARFVEAEDFYGSDHRPLIGWLE